MNAATLSILSLKSRPAPLAGCTPVPPWQQERARRLHRLFLRAEKAQASGQRRSAIFRRLQAQWPGRTLRSAPAKALPGSPKSFYRLLRRWQARGRTPEALLIAYKPLRSQVSGAMLCRFIEVCAAQPFATHKGAWAAFSRQERRAGGQRRAEAAISYGQLQYYFPGRHFAALQAAQRQAAQDVTQLLAVRARLIAGIAQRLPGTPRLRRRQRLRKG